MTLLCYVGQRTAYILVQNLIFIYMIYMVLLLIKFCFPFIHYGFEHSDISRDDIHYVIHYLSCLHYILYTW